MANAKRAREKAQLEALISSGVKSVTTDGVTTSFDLDQARKRLDELKRLDRDADAKRLIQPIDLGSAW